MQKNGDVLALARIAGVEKSVLTIEVSTRAAGTCFYRGSCMTMNPRNKGWARALGGVCLSSAVSLGLAACSGEGADEPVDDPGASVARPTPAGGQGGSSPQAPASTDEGNPPVTGIDRGSDDAVGDEDDADGERDADPGTEAAQDADGPIEGPEVPDSDHCAAVADWDPEWAAFEEEVLELVNEFRSRPADCGVEGQFQAAPPLAMDPTLRCSARLHSVDMFEREYFAHDNPDGLDPFERMQEAGFQGQRMGENIAQGQPTPEQVMLDWMASDGHCANIMLPQYTLIGIGFEAGTQQVFGGASNYWTQNFGTPFPERRGR